MKPELATGRIQEVIDGLLMALDFKTRIKGWRGACMLPEGVPHVEQAVEDLKALLYDIEKDIGYDERCTEAGSCDRYVPMHEKEAE